MENKPISIGIENYKQMVDKEYYYIDKTLFIKDLLDKGGAVNVFTRPRRFGKTLALSMIKTYFEKETDYQGNIVDNSSYFIGKNIIKAGEKYTCHMGKYPVISLSLKSAKQPDFQMAYTSLIDEIIKEYERHSYVLCGNVLSEENHDRYKRIMSRKAEPIDYAKSLKFLSDCLKKYHNTGVIILIDEYDVPLENSYFRGFFDKMIDFIRSLFESALKTNDSLEFAIITGCLRIAEEAPSSLGSKRPHQVNEVGFPTKLEKTSLSSQCQSIFTGLNNLEINSILTQNYAEYYGFTEAEVEKMLKDYELEEKIPEAKEWYDGYLFGDTEVYNPWSVINYVKTAISNKNPLPKPYWSNTSSNSIVRNLVEKAEEETKAEIETLIQGGIIEKPVHENITYEDIDKSQDNLWNFLFFTGYLKKAKEVLRDETIYLTMKIPNREVRYIFQNTIQEWFQQRLEQANLSILYTAVLEGDCDTFASAVTDQLLECISYNDYKEDYYHGFLCGLLKGCKGYRVISNRESGTGRYDIVMRYPSARGKAMIMEIKMADGYRDIIKYGICFYKKECMVKKCQF